MWPVPSLPAWSTIWFEAWAVFWSLILRFVFMLDSLKVGEFGCDV
jgi:hypothetical protein